MTFHPAVYNNCVNNGYFPNTRKVSKIVVVINKGNFLKPQNSRLIFLLFNLGYAWSVGLQTHKYYSLSDLSSQLIIMILREIELCEQLQNFMKISADNLGFPR